MWLIAGGKGKLIWITHIVESFVSPKNVLEATEPRLL